VQDAFDPGYRVNMFTHESPFMYNQSALNYSEAVAANSKYFQFIPDFFKVIHSIEPDTTRKTFT